MTTHPSHEGRPVTLRDFQGLATAQDMKDLRLATAQDMKDLREDMKELFRLFSEKFDSLEKRITALEQRMDAVEADLKTVKKVVFDLMKRGDDIEYRLENDMRGGFDRVLILQDQLIGIVKRRDLDDTLFQDAMQRHDETLRDHDKRLKFLEESRN